MANKPGGYLLGQETELAIRFDPARSSDHPGNKVIFDHFYQAISTIVKTKNGKRNFIQDQFFVQNGGAIYYEHHPQSLRKGLIECATPECSSTHELILYQRAAERLLQKAIPLVKAQLNAIGIDGELSLLKNSRDFEGNTYGSQENYDSFLASGLRLLLLRTLLIAYLPIALAFKVLYVGLLIPFVISVFAAKLCTESLLVLITGMTYRSRDDKAGLLTNLRQALRRHTDRLNFDAEDQDEFLLKLEYAVFYPIFWLSYKPLITIYNRMCFKDQKKALEAHVITRIIYTGAGSILDDGSFILSEKSLAINNSERRSIHRTDKPLFDCGNLIKDYELAIWEVFILRFKAWKKILSSTQRLQIAYSDSNRSHIAEFLKVGVTGLLIRIANADGLKAAPRLKYGVGDLHKVTKDLSFAAKLELTDGSEMTALEIQQRYLQLATDYLQTPRATLEDHEIVRLWREVLGKIKTDTTSLLGRLDWVTKKYLLQSSDGQLEYWSLKKIDLKYHELGTGYFDLMQRDGMTLDIFTSEEVERAVFEPSSPDRVKLRSRLIQSVSLADQPMTISWSQAKIGRWNPKVISLSDYKNNHEDIL